MEKLRQTSSDLIRMVRERYQRDHGKPGPEDDELISDLRSKGFKITETHKGERFADSVDESGFKKLNERGRLLLHVLAVAAENYYFGVLIEDPFNAEAEKLGLTGAVAITHATDLRRAYQTEMLANPVYSRIEARSKFRVGTISGVWSTLDDLSNIIETLKIDTPEAKEICALDSQLPPIHSSNFKYTNMSHEEKVEVMEKMDQIAGSVLKLLRSIDTHGAKEND